MWTAMWMPSPPVGGANTGVGSQVLIGGSYDRGSGEVGLNGLIDEVSIYNRTLSLTEVQSLMAAGTVAAGTISAASAVSVAASSTVDLNGKWQSVAGLSGAGTVNSTLASGTPYLVVNNSTPNATAFSGTLANTAGSLSLMNAGTNNLTLNGTAANTYTGSTMVNGGSLIEDFANAASATDLINSGSTLVLGGGALQVLQKSATTTSQTFAGTTINPGFSKVIGTQVGSGAVNIALGALTQNPGGTVDFTNTSSRPPSPRPRPMSTASLAAGRPLEIALVTFLLVTGLALMALVRLFPTLAIPWCPGRRQQEPDQRPKTGIMLVKRPPPPLPPAPPSTR
jgi:autotransporter-associated beta strand protein